MNIDIFDKLRSFVERAIGSLSTMYIWLDDAKLILETVDKLRAEIARRDEQLHDEMSQLEIATDLGNKRWVALNEIYENAEKHNANWCKRKAQEGLGIK